MVTRNNLLELIDTYKNTQKSGRKDSDKQIAIFADDCLWLGFTDPRLLSGGGIQVANGAAALLTLFNNYNNMVKDMQKVDIQYLNEFADPESLICGFSMLIQLISKGQSKPSTFFNTLHLHVNQDCKVVKAYNWMGSPSEGYESIADFI